METLHSRIAELENVGSWSEALRCYELALQAAPDDLQARALRHARFVDVFVFSSLYARTEVHLTLRLACCATSRGDR